jgi:bla regulator protein BlaR1
MHVLLNWLWQGCVVVVATAAVLHVLRRLHATQRYCIWWAALLWVVILPVFPAFLTGPEGPLGTSSADRLLPVVSVPDIPYAAGVIAVVLWCVWIVVHAIRIAVAVRALRGALARSWQIPSAVETRLRHWARIKEQGRRTRLVLSDGVRAAAVLGVVSPRIALAPALLEHLNDEELDRVVAHEWAHVQRRDDLANLIQLLVRVMAGWHPAVWWIDRQLHFEREVACDDTAVITTGSPKAYAASLAKLASLPRARCAALPAPGALSSSGIGKRIVRILTPRAETSSGRTFAAATTATVVLSATAWCVAGFQLVQVAVPAVAAAVTADRTAVTVVGSVSRPASDAAVPHPASRRAVSQIPRRGPSVRAELRTPGSTRAQPMDESALVSNESGHSPAVDRPPLPATVLPVGVDHARLPFSPALSGSPLHVSATTVPPVDAARAPSPWSAAADAGEAFGRSSKNAAVATAGLFSRFGKKIASSF